MFWFLVVVGIFFVQSMKFLKSSSGTIGSSGQVSRLLSFYQEFVTPNAKVFSDDILPRLQKLVARIYQLVLDEWSAFKAADAFKSSPPPPAGQLKPATNLVHSLIELQARTNPDKIAVQFEEHQGLSYRELNETANAVAKQLVTGRGCIVPIAVERSNNLVIALLAVLKAGAAYVLLSPDAPVGRNQFIIDDVHASFVITDRAMQGLFTNTKEVSIEDLLERTPHMDPNSRANLDIYQDASDIAYVIYTSGTTGNPKGVLLSHMAAHCGLSALPLPDPSLPLRQLLCHSPNFSAAQRTILGTLTRGGTLCLASKESLTLNLHETIQQMNISSLEITPSMLKLIDASSIPKSIRKITLGGEVVGPALVQAWASKVELISAYGLSECTQVCVHSRSDPSRESLELIIAT
jgi:non-ribosomal peptide synthetase component F